MYYSEKKENGRRGRLAIILMLTCFLSVQAQETTDNHSWTTEQGQMPTDSVAIDSLSPEERQMPWDVRIKTELDRLAREADNAYYHTGICVWDLTTDSFLWGYNNRKVMRPASTQKVLTAISALSVIGAQHEFKTRAYYTGSISADSVLAGDIYVVGDFDPLYSISDLKELARNIRDLGIRAVRGKIYADASMKSSDLYGNGWCWDDVPSKYEPYLCALMVERGKMAPSFTSYSQDASFHPAAHFAYILSQELRSLKITGADGIAIDYGMKEYSYNGRNFYTKTRTIDQVMQRMLKNSDNLHAEAVFFQLAHFNTGKHCTWKDGARQVENVLRKAGTSTSYVEIADGSGVSLYNYVSPDAQVAMLRYAYKNDDIYRYFLPALPIAGVDGTLDTRMTSGPAHRNVRAKTGTLEGCIALSGYVTASNGHQLAFSILVNGVLSAKVARDYQDRVCQELAR
ncbi:MAG: D-alanyl-D-alanine carboxypeptidase/D-alanyl-D-alanine-endopeptidase [Bacteroidaceae bacterium]|nr:D-alanyl-D-alanine carboxypeptidase/D-alanyl-D-alanine-endopeptidase [Bacteroidaceae bacterium]